MTDSANTQTMSRRRALAMAAATATVPAIPAIGEASAANTDEGPLTVEQAASLDFEPWERKPDGWKPPTRAEWAALENPHLVTLRIAHAFMFKTKGELVEIIEKIDEETGWSLYRQFTYTIDYFKMLLSILESAECRIICAGSVIELREEAKVPQSQSLSV